MNRKALIRPLVENKRVLDVGAIAHTFARSKKEFWLHEYLVEHARFVLGVDILSQEVAKANSAGYHFVVGDAERLHDSIKERFDVVVAGELIEHLSNPGLFLESVKRVLVSDGVLILTTPNAFAAGNTLRIVRAVLGMHSSPINPEHKMWFCETTLSQLLTAHGFVGVKVRSIRPEREKGWRGALKGVLYGKAQSKLFCEARTRV